MKISHKLTLGFLCTALLVSVVGYISVGASQKALQVSIGEQASALAVRMLEHIEESIYSRIETLEEYSRDSKALRAISESNEEFEKLEDIQVYISEKDREWVSVPEEEVTAFMHESIDNELSERLREKVSFYKEKCGYRVFGEVFVTNKYGTNIAQTGKTTDYYQADELWWQMAKKDGLYVADVDYDRSSGVYSTDICIRIDDESGNFLGIMKAVLNIEETMNLIRKAEAETRYKSIQFKLLSADRKIIYATDKFEFLQNISKKFSSLLQHNEDVHGHASYFKVTGDKPDEGEELIAYVHSKGYRDYKGLGWILIIELGADEIFASVAKLRTHILIIALVITTVAVLLGIFISKTLSNPIKKLVAATEKIGTGNLNTHLEVKSNDEIGQLATSFNKMIDDLKNTTTSIYKLNREIAERKQAEAELKTTQGKLLEVARKAGMAEVAADVLHNVGNVLNSINVSTTMITEKMANSELINLEKLAGLINEHIEDLGVFLTEHPQGKYVPVYLTEVGKCLIDEQSEIVSRLRELANNVEHIREIIRTQQSYAKVAGVEVQVSIAKLVEDAIQINSAGLQRHGTQLVREFDELPDIEIDKQKVLQILVNLISNAKYAVSNNGKDEKTVIIRVYKHCEACFRIEVADNGVGISEENLTKIFNHGFTTKKHGHGFGLHSSALAAKELGGGLTVHSDGMGQGATFTLELPFKPVGMTK